MPRPMSIYKSLPTGGSVKVHSFIETRRGIAYAYNGKVKTYSNKSQAEKMKEKLAILGYNVFVSFEWPFLLHEDMGVHN